jgi:hypothetical protein
VYLNLLKGFSVFLGALSGGFISKHLAGFIFESGIVLVFLVSGILRFVTAIFFFNKIKEMRLIEIQLGPNFLQDSIIIVPRPNIIFQTTEVYAKKKPAEILANEKPKQKAMPKISDEEKRKLLGQYFKTAQNKSLELEKKDSSLIRTLEKIKKIRQ